MKVQALDDQGRIRWAEVPDDALGELSRPVSLEGIIRARARVAATVHAAVYQSKAMSVLKRCFNLSRSDMRSLLQKGWGTPRQLAGLELAFQSAARRVKLTGWIPKA